MKQENIEKPLEALKPLITAIDINDSDTLAMLTPDSSVIWQATGSWSSPANVTIGDFRKIRSLVEAIKKITGERTCAHAPFAASPVQ